MARIAALAATLVCGFVLSGCGALYQYPDSQAEDTAPACSDGIDNDVDGRTDCLDDGCTAYCTERDAFACDNGDDDDLDGWIDCKDPNCAEFCPEQGAAACNDGQDNDADGRSDCEDHGCDDYCQEYTEAACSDGADNDRDELRDCEDVECADFDFCREDTAEHCADSRDNDSDGRFDCADPNCAVVDFCREDSATTCADDIDNDFDGVRDCDDADCETLCGEHEPDECADGEDNDQDGRVDCDDGSCDGHCPEEDPLTCNDERDNDGDGLKDSADPLCWQFSPPEIRRCATLAGRDFADGFESSSASWFGSAEGDYYYGVGSREPLLNPRSDNAVGLGVVAEGGFETQNLSGLIEVPVFSGSWEGFELAFSHAVFARTKLQVGLVPSALAELGHAPAIGAEAAIVAVTLDASRTPAVFALDVQGQHVEAELALPATCQSVYCNDGWGRTTVTLSDESLVATVETPSGEGESVSETIGLLAPTDLLPPSRLVVWGGSGGGRTGLLDDLLLRHRSISPCGHAVPQIPAPESTCSDESDVSLASFGHTTSLAQGPEELCALVTSGPSAAGRAERVLAFRSVGGRAWESGDDAAEPEELALPRGATVTGAAVAWDEGTKRWVAAVLHRTRSDVRLSLFASDDCRAWGAPVEGPALPPDTEAPSYVVSAGRHEVYFTRPPTDDTLRTLWRAAGPTQGELEFEPVALFELPADQRALPPVAVQRIGKSDLVLSFPALSSVGPSSTGILVGDSSGKRWIPLPGVSLAIPPVLDAAFDSEGVVSSALSFGENGGVLLYGGRRRGRILAGTAQLIPAGNDDPREAPLSDACGDGTCESAEDCDSCPDDCTCRGPALVQAPLADPNAWQLVNTGYSDGWFFVDGAAQRLHWAVQDGRGYLPLDAPVTSDFELAFDIPGGETSAIAGAIVVGLGADPTGVGPGGSSDTVLATSGIFANLIACPTGIHFAPFVSPLGGLTEGCPLEGDTLGIQPGPTDRHIVLRRERGLVSVEASGDGLCTGASSLTTNTLPGDLTGIVVEISGPLSVGTISNLKLRLLEDPADCPRGETRCETEQTAVCVDTRVSPEHCGGCSDTCHYPAACDDGSCTCPLGTDFCGSDCVDLGQREHCGTCNNACTVLCVERECEDGAGCDDAAPFPADGGWFDFEIGPLQLADSGDAAPCDGLMDLEVAFAWTPPLADSATSQGVFSLEADPGTVYGITSDPACGTYDLCGVIEGEAPGPSKSERFDVAGGQTYRVVVGHPQVESSVPARIYLGLY